MKDTEFLVRQAVDQTLLLWATLKELEQELKYNDEWAFVQDAIENLAVIYDSGSEISEATIRETLNDLKRC
jgi:IS1 family transposase